MKQSTWHLTLNHNKSFWKENSDVILLATEVSKTSYLTLRLLMSYIYGAPSKARNANVVYIWTYVWQR